MERGKFIVFEGIDGSGKSTLVKMLEKKMASLDLEAHFTFEPTNKYIGTLIREILHRKRKADEQTIAALYLADRIEHVYNEEYGILQFVDRGIHVVSDRHYLSSYAYHSSYVSLDWIIDAHAICRKAIQPDIVFFIDISVEESLRRLTANREELDRFETKERITQVKNNYEKAIERVSDSENIIRINGERPSEVILEDVWKIIESYLRD